MCVCVYCACVLLWLLNYCQIKEGQRVFCVRACECVSVCACTSAAAAAAASSTGFSSPAPTKVVGSHSLLLSLSLCHTVYDNWPSRLSYSSAFRCRSFFFIHLHIIRYICSSMYICIAIGLDWVPTSVSAELSKRMGCISTFNLNWLFVASSSHIGFNL